MDEVFEGEERPLASSSRLARTKRTKPPYNMLEAAAAATITTVEAVFLCLKAGAKAGELRLFTCSLRQQAY